MTKSAIFISALSAVTLTILTSCHHTTLEDKAAQVAQDYTERYCPTPEQDMTITDSIGFDRSTKTFNYYYRLTGEADNAKAVAKVQKDLSKSLVKAMKENTSMKVFKDASYNFNYIYRSTKTGKVLYQKIITPKDYKEKVTDKTPQ